ncbi:phosphoglycerate mutase-like protein [Laetiporus sulphureus 93-53]|uniref:Phytase A n=1 Tax=Laetiporus sulphureus 93-53 TaxID=1314785 RepID=A0A165HWV8_9APHY|nr:phosphoglycerate mutase-like protein [Laetiporus sulphureus 93-53]KZT12295.1 phosphoglycerate mutase-like protein [Laetiporus sulphureus 93-53]
MWGQYSPYYPANEYSSPPSSCNITQLQRHGARYPAHEDAPTYRDAVDKLTSVTRYHDERLDFLEDYEYNLDEDVLVPLGMRQSWESGYEAFARYGEVIKKEKTIFLRASDSQRVVDSAVNWTKGFAAASQSEMAPKIEQLLSEKVNNTLNNDCPASSDGVAEMNTWLKQFAPPIAKRLNTAAPGANLTDEDVFGLMALCPFESIAMAHADAESKKKTKARSKFCALFNDDEWAAFEYHGDVEKYYKTGPGNKLGPVQGVGYVNELIARLTGTTVRDHTTHNASLPFPLDRTLYADFSHENDMVAVYAAMGLFDARDARAPDPRRMPSDGDDGADGRRVWRASRMVPFSARMVVERLECASDQEGGREAGTCVRVLVNDALQPLGFCGAEEGERICTLDAFVKSQEYARGEGQQDFKKCYK